MITIFTCQDQFDDMMTCIYEAWASRLGHSNLRLMTEPIGNLELFCQYRHIAADSNKTESVIRTIRQKISNHAYRMVYRAAMSFYEDKLDAIYRFLTIGFYCGPSVIHYLQEPAVIRLFELNRKVCNEAHYFREFIRFAEMPGRILVSHIEPKCNVLTLVAPNFADRMPSENWMIIDDNRRQAIVHPADQDYYLTPLTTEEIQQLSQEKDDPFVDLWEGFFEHIGIKERKNPLCQRSMLPLWYRKHMVEFTRKQ